ncbi:MAG: hypothetical protein KGS61_15040 [Verrucomicrobia bacterium]|nr:hypothetical protein [Verrucomicrobiota bacterium]
MWAKWCKFVIAVLLLPACWGAARALYRVLLANGGADTVWVPLLAGAACWGAVFCLLPRPMWLYVVGHELTHAVWTWLFGGRVTRFRASAQGGHVLVTKSNFLVALAPYFFPFYAVLVVALFGAGTWFLGWAAYRVWFHLLLGAAYAFHVSLTWQILQVRQTDITSQGYLFSAVIIFLGNVLTLLVAVPLLTGQTEWWIGLDWWWRETADTVGLLARWLALQAPRIHL